VPRMPSAARRSESPRAVLARHGVDAKKSWGQNFLVDPTVQERIVRAAHIGLGEVIVEIGAGVGTLTSALLWGSVAPGKILAVERDPDMLAVLNLELGRESRVEIHPQNAVHFDFVSAARMAGRPLLVVGNLPYQITTALLFAIIDAGDAVARSILMVQREFAERVVADPGSKVYGRLSVMVQQRMRARILFNVPAGAFFPRPRVVSSVMSIERRPEPWAPVRDEALFARVVKDAFATRRKMLRRSLGASFGDHIAAAAFASSGVDGTRRPEDLSVAELARLTEGLAAAQAATRPTAGG
jgi:16S rRNA (adenine1518-N6/adenine1519-N6)-dimethyltransferase